MSLYSSPFDLDEVFSVDELAAVSREIASGWGLAWQDAPSEVVLMPVDPHFIHAYWNISEVDLEQRGLHHSTKDGCYVFRMVPLANGVEPQEDRAFEFEVQGLRNDRSVWMPPGERSFRAEIGLRKQGGGFEVLKVSNQVEMPPPAVPPQLALVDVGVPLDSVRFADVVASHTAAQKGKTLAERAGGSEVVHEGFKERGVYFDEMLIDRLIIEKLSKRLPGSRFEGLLETGKKGDWGQTDRLFFGDSQTDGLTASGAHTFDIERLLVNV